MSRALALLTILLLLAPSVAAEYLVVGLNVTPASTSITDMHLAFTGSILSSGGLGSNITLQVIDDGWRSVSRARITASLTEVADAPNGSTTLADRASTRAIALVPVTDRALLLVTRSSEGPGSIVDLRAASCGERPLCPNCARAFPDWCSTATRRADQSGPIDRGVLFGVLLNLIVIGTIAVLLITHRRS